MATKHPTATRAERRSPARRLARLRRLYGAPWLFALVVAVMVGDVATTGAGLGLGLREANPLVADVIVRYGLAGMVALKAVAGAVLVGLPLIAPRPRLTFRVSSVLYALVGTIAVLSNLVHIWLVI